MLRLIDDKYYLLVNGKKRKKEEYRTKEVWTEACE